MATTTRRNRRWQSVLLLLASIALTLLALEVALSFRLPFARTSTPRRMGPAGKTFEPHAEVRWTNYLDYAETQRANALGFLDREPPSKKDPGVFRIVALGDSFVEAMQVPIAAKFHVALEQMLARQYPGRRFETVAFGQSSAATASELAFYEAFGRALEPDLVIVVFVHNDFADNSPLLGSLAYGWHPDHPPWPLIAADPGGNGFRRLAADRDFQRYALGIEAPPDSSARLKDALGWSRLIQLGIAAWTQGFGWTAKRQHDVESLRMARLRGEQRFRDALEGWRYPDDLDHNEMFFAKEMPPVFEEAEAITDHAFALFAEEQRRRGFAMLIVAIPSCSATPWHHQERRELVDRGMLGRLERIGARHAIPVLDLAAAFSRKRDAKAAHWRHDAHWSPTGHRWAAEAIAEFIVANEERMLAPRRQRKARVSDMPVDDEASP